MAEFIYESYVYNCIDRYSKRLLKDQKQILRHYWLTFSKHSLNITIFLPAFEEEAGTR